MKSKYQILVGKLEGKKHLRAKNEWDVDVTRQAVYY
jgi:hypothetical protein